MAEHRVCPWWLGYLLASPVRRLLYSPATILAPYVREGMTVLEPGPGMGFFTLEIARRAGAVGRVVAVDIEPKMLDVLKQRAAKKGLLPRIDTRIAADDSMGLGDLAASVDFVLAFAMVHELPSAAHFFEETAATLKPGASLLIAEPAGHVTDALFDAELQDAARAGLTVMERPHIRRSLAALLTKR